MSIIRTEPATPRMNLRALAQAGERLEVARAAVDRELDIIADELSAAGPHANYALAAKLTDLSRTTLYRRVPARVRELEARSS